MTTLPPPENSSAPGSSSEVVSVWADSQEPRRVGLAVLAVLGIALAGLAALGVFVYFTTFLGSTALLISLFLALVPLTLVLVTVRWIDRWNPEPRPALVFALFWGAGISVLSALLFDLGVQITIASSAGMISGSDFASAVIQAPLVEEIVKGLGVLILFFAVRRHFHGPLDGVVYAATIAAGFAFSENIQYFGLALTEGTAGSLGVTFVLRGIFSPFAHVTFTMCTGLALGRAARRGVPRGAVAGYFLLGLFPAIALHALWNGASFALAGDVSMLAYYLVVQVPLFCGAIAVVLLLRRNEARVTLRRLHEYCEAGWFTSAEVSLLGTSNGRRQALAWASRQTRGQKLAMRQFIADATHLAFVRDRRVREPSSAALASQEAGLLERVMRHQRNARAYTPVHPPREAFSDHG